MRSETFSASSITAQVRSRNRRTAITEATYAKAIRDAHPEIDEYAQAAAQVMKPGLPIDTNGNIRAAATPEETAAIENFLSQIAYVELKHGIGKAYGEAMNAVVPLIARIVTIGGASFSVNSDGVLPDADVVKAFEDWLNDEGEDTSFWNVLGETVKKLDAPLTPVQARPPETLTTEEQADPKLPEQEPAISSS